MVLLLKGPVVVVLGLRMPVPVMMGVTVVLVLVLVGVAVVLVFVLEGVTMMLVLVLVGVTVMLVPVLLGVKVMPVVMLAMGWRATGQLVVTKESYTTQWVCQNRRSPSRIVKGSRRTHQFLWIALIDDVAADACSLQGIADAGEV